MPQELSPEVAAAFAQRRQKLLAKWGDGARLTAEERAEISDLLPAQAKVVDPVPPPPPDPAQAVAAPFVLEAPPAAKPVGYLHSYAHYAEHLAIWDPETSIESRIRQIKRMVADGKEHQPRPDLPPFDQPDQLGAWWSRVRKRRVPARILAVAAPPPVAGENSSTPPAASEARGNEAPPPPVFQQDLSKVQAGSLEQGLADLRVATAGAFQAYSDALAAGRNDVEVRRRAWVNLQEELRKAEAAAEKMLINRGELIPRAELRNELRRVHSAMAGSLRTILLDAGLEPELADRLVTSFFRPLRDGKLGVEETQPDSPQPRAA